MKRRLFIAQGKDAGQDPLDPICPVLPHLQRDTDVTLVRGGSLRVFMRNIRLGEDLLLFDMTEPREALWMRDGPRQYFSAVLMGTQRVDWADEKPKWMSVVALDADVPGATYVAARVLGEPVQVEPRYSSAAVGGADFLYAAMLGRRLMGKDHSLLAIATNKEEGARAEALLSCLGDERFVEVSVAPGRARLAAALSLGRTVVDGLAVERRDWPGLSDACFTGLRHGVAAQSFWGPLESLPDRIASFVKEAPAPDPVRAAHFANGRNAPALARLVLKAAEAARARSASLEAAS